MTVQVVKVERAIGINDVRFERRQCFIKYKFGVGLK